MRDVISQFIKCKNGEICINICSNICDNVLSKFFNVNFLGRVQRRDGVVETITIARNTVEIQVTKGVVFKERCLCMFLHVLQAKNADNSVVDNDAFDIE